MLAPQMIGLAVFTILPILWVIRLSFFEFNGFQSDFIGFDNFVRAFTRDPYYWRALLNTIVISFGKLLVEIPLALVCAVLLNGKLRGSSLYRTVFMPSVMSPAIIGLVFASCFRDTTGLSIPFWSTQGLSISTSTGSAPS